MRGFILGVAIAYLLTAAPSAADQHEICTVIDGQIVCSEEEDRSEQSAEVPEPDSPSVAEPIDPGLPAVRREGPVRYGGPPAMANGSSGAVRTSRSFLGPHEFPPEAFAAYGIVAFPARAVTERARERHLDACRAYVATLPTPSELAVPPEEQMVTVWPLDDSALAAELTERSDPEVCETAVNRYHLGTALSALTHARLAGREVMRGRGPFLLAWSPSSQKGKPDALVLVANLSSAFSYAHFEDYFRQWREDIEQSPELWERGWSLSLVRVRIRDWADRWGTAILTLRGG